LGAFNDADESAGYMRLPRRCTPRNDLRIGMKPSCYIYYSGNNICQNRHSRESGNPALAWMPDQVRHDRERTGKPRLVGGELHI